jgi:hypothetical protein
MFTFKAKHFPDDTQLSLLLAHRKFAGCCYTTDQDVQVSFNEAQVEYFGALVPILQKFLKTFMGKCDVFLPEVV